jgi:hydrogenase/urease accessory protein HupE
MACDHGGERGDLAMKRMTIVGLTAALILAAGAHAHEVRPAYLELRETIPDTYEAMWKVPARGGRMRLALSVRLPADVRPVGAPAARFVNDAYIARWRFERPGGLAGATIHIDGLAATTVDALIRLTTLDGNTQTHRATPGEPRALIAERANAWDVARTYTALGIEHILLGIDHLLFVLALVLIVKDWRRLVQTITAFTVAHSITLSAATLGLVHVPSPPVEACIALSIVFVAAEIVRGHRGTPGLTERSPWIVAFSFGLLHGLGFAGALSEIGLPQDAVPMALLFFNVGVELGQIAFVAAVLALGAMLRPIFAGNRRWTEAILPYAIGSIAMFWVLQRVSAF